MGMNEASPRLLLVDDDPSVTTTLSRFLELSGFETTVLSNGRQALEQIPQIKPDLIVLDVLMPEVNGRETLRRLRERGDWTPVILLTQVSGTAERIMALEEGADDYLNKPFDPQELVVRIKAILRRTQTKGPRFQTLRRLVSGVLILDRASRRVYLNGSEVPLTPKSVSILEHLMLHPDELVSRERLLDAAWGWESVVGARVVDTRIAELRKALKDDAANPQFIETVSGQGYRFISEVSGLET